MVATELERDWLFFLVYEFLVEEQLTATAHRLEQESGFYFNIRYFRDMVMGGKWEDVDNYLSGFTKPDNTGFLLKILFAIHKHKFLEARCEDPKAARNKLIIKLEKQIRANQSFCNKMWPRFSGKWRLETICHHLSDLLSQRCQQMASTSTPADNTLPMDEASSEHARKRLMPMGMLDGLSVMPPSGAIGATAGTNTAIPNQSASVAYRFGLSGEGRCLASTGLRTADEYVEKRKQTEIGEHYHCQSMKLPDSLSATKVLAKLRGHQTRIIGLAFSDVQSILVSSGADAQLIVWNIISWEKQACKFLQIPSGLLSTSPTDTRIQFHHDQLHFLVVHERLMAIYETKCLECLKEWAPREAHRLITCAAYSCDYKLIYACFNDGVICIFHPSTLSPQYSISRSTYLPLGINSCVYPTVVAAHPSIPTQFTVGLTDGDIYVLEILVSEQKTMSAPATLNSGQNIEDFDLNQ